MRIVSSSIPGTAPVSQVSSHSETEEIRATAGVKPAEMQSSLLHPAIAELKEMPDIDQAKVDALRGALARGEISFNASRIASLIERYHTGR